MEYVIVSAILCLLLFMSALGTQYSKDTKHFLSIGNSTAMRGIWCVIVILVHIPVQYQNRIQDLIGSFAYIGVTFFFMTSAYGLKFSYMKNQYYLNSFWRNRLIKLLIPCILLNTVMIAYDISIGNEVSKLSLIRIDSWVKWLLLCYFIFWLIYRYTNFNEDLKDGIISIIIVTISLLFYIFNSNFPHQ